MTQPVSIRAMRHGYGDTKSAMSLSDDERKLIMRLRTIVAGDEYQRVTLDLPSMSIVEKVCTRIEQLGNGVR